MALTRKMLKAMGIEDEKIDQIIEAHTETTDALKADRDKYKVDAEKLPSVQKELDEAKEELGKKSDDPYKEKYEKEHKEYTEYKKGIEAEQEKAKKVEAYKALLKKAGVGEKHLELILEGTKFDDMKLTDDGKIEDADEREKNIKEKYKIYIPDVQETGANTETPPDGNGAGGKQLSRAAQVVAKHNERLYGVKPNPTKGEDK